MCYLHSISGVNPIATTRHPFEVLSQLVVTGDRLCQPNPPLRHYDDSATVSGTPIDIVYSLVHQFQPNQPMRHHDDLSTDFETPIDIVHLRPIERKDIPRPKTRQKLHNNLHPMMTLTNTVFRFQTIQKDDQQTIILFLQQINLFLNDLPLFLNLIFSYSTMFLFILQSINLGFIFALVSFMKFIYSVDECNLNDSIIHSDLQV